MPHLSLLLAFLGASLTAVQAPPAAGPVPAPVGTPVTVQLITACDFPDVLGGQRVRIPALAVKHVLGPRLLVVGKPRIFGIDRSYQETFRYDNLLVLLPAAASLTREQTFTVIGEVRTAAAARALGVRLDAEATDKKALEKVQSDLSIEKMVLVVADSVETPDGVVLVGRR